MSSTLRVLLLAIVTIGPGPWLSAASAQDRPTIFIHGLKSDPSTWQEAAARLSQRLAIEPHRPATDWRAEFPDQARQILNNPEIAPLPANTVAVGHSNGGVVARQLSRSRPLGGIVTIGTPHYGAAAAFNLPRWNEALFGVIDFQAGLHQDIHDAEVFFGIFIDILDILDFVHNFTVRSLVDVGAQIGLDLGVPVLRQMIPGSTFFRDLNSAENLSREAAAIPSRVGVVNFSPNNYFGGPFRVIAPESADAISDDLVVASVVLNAAAAALWLFDPFDPGADIAYSIADKFEQLSDFLQDYEYRWCAAISSNSNSYCLLATDGVVPYYAQEFPGAPNIYWPTGPAHTRETTNPDTIEKLFDALSVFVQIPPRVSCPVSLSSNGSSFPSSGGSAILQVGAQDGCTWSTATTASWLSVSGSGTGHGNGALSLAVAQNTGADPRSAAAIVNGATVTIAQSGTTGGACAPSLDVDNWVAPAAGGTKDVHLSNGNSCSWTAQSSTDWLSVQPTSGSGSAVVHVSAGPIQGSPKRTGTVTIAGRSFQVTQKPLGSPTALRKIIDFDGDGKSDVAYYHPPAGTWWIVRSGTGQGYSYAWGAGATAIPVPGDYDGDGITDLAYYFPPTTMWWWVSSQTGQANNSAWGSPGAIPVPGDYDGDGRTDFAYYYPQGGTWNIWKSSDGQAYSYAWGDLYRALPVPADYDGDGKTDLAYYSPASTLWWIVGSRTGQSWSSAWGSPQAVPTPGDYDGDGKADLAYYYPQTGTWYVWTSSNGQSYSYAWGAGSTAVPVPADYDGDGKTDLTYFFPPTGTWWGVSSRTRQGWSSIWGAATSTPVTSLVSKRPTSARSSPVALRQVFDFDADGKSDIAYYHTGLGRWYFVRSSDGQGSYTIKGIPGASHHILVPGDYDGDARTDVAYYDPVAATWNGVSSLTGAAWSYAWGSPGAIPVPGDYDGDGRTDLAFYNPPDGAWHIVRSTDGQSYYSIWGPPGVNVTPVPADYDGDGKTDIAYYLASNLTWNGVSSRTGQGWSSAWGSPGAIPVPGDYDGDGKADIAYYYPPTGTWWIVRSNNGQGYSYAWGAGSTAIPVAADFDGDGRTDMTYFFPPTGTWWGVSSLSGQGWNSIWGGPDSRPLAITAVAPTCLAAVLSTTSVTFGPIAGTQTIGVTAASGCAWTATTNTPWITISAGGTGVGNGTITLTAAFNRSRRKGTVTVAGQTITVLQRGATTADFDGDGRADMGVYRPSTGQWPRATSSTEYAGSETAAWGTTGDTPVLGDYDGDGQADAAVFRPCAGGGCSWYILKSSTSNQGYMSLSWGLGSDTPVPADYDGDGRTDVAVYRPCEGTAGCSWYILKSSGEFTTWIAPAWGLATDIPVPADYDGDGKADLAVYRPCAHTNGCSWYILTSTSNYTSSLVFTWGLATDIPVPADYDGDGKADIAVYRPSTGGWFFLLSATGYSTTGQYWGTSDDTPMPADYDGDGKADLALFNRTNGRFSAIRSGTQTIVSANVGVDGDIPVPRRP